jgi:hypothetical protein
MKRPLDYRNKRSANSDTWRVRSVCIQYIADKADAQLGESKRHAARRDPAPFPPYNVWNHSGGVYQLLPTTFHAALPLSYVDVQMQTKILD